MITGPKWSQEQGLGKDDVEATGGLVKGGHLTSPSFEDGLIKSFTEALSAGDIETALEGFKKLGNIKNPEMILSIKKAISVLEGKWESNPPNASEKEKLNEIERLIG